MHRSVDASEAVTPAQAGSAWAGPARAGTIHPDTTVGTVRLTVSDLPRVRAFYEQILGLTSSDDEQGAVLLSVPGGPGLVELHGQSDAPVRDPRSPGLFHLAVLMPDRASLAMALARLATAGWPLDGASDHLVSEALYLSDPEGNGIEIYRDRPREEWPVEDGRLVMATLPLDLENLLAELGDAPQVEPQAPAGTKMGHVHLQVSDLAEAEEFYVRVLGFEVTVRRYPGALFVSAGGYHHHLGLNTWHSAGSPAPPQDVRGLRSFDVVVPGTTELDAILARVRAAGLETQPQDRGILVRDPFGNGVLLRSN